MSDFRTTMNCIVIASALAVVLALVSSPAPSMDQERTVVAQETSIEQELSAAATVGDELSFALSGNIGQSAK